LATQRAREISLLAGSVGAARRIPRETLRRTGANRAKLRGEDDNEMHLAVLLESGFRTRRRGPSARALLSARPENIN
jgi:hypothetical protein